MPLSEGFTFRLFGWSQNIWTEFKCCQNASSTLAIHWNRCPTGAWFSFRLYSTSSCCKTRKLVENKRFNGICLAKNVFFRPISREVFSTHDNLLYLMMSSSAEFTFELCGRGSNIWTEFTRSWNAASKSSYSAEIAAWCSLIINPVAGIII